MLNRIRVVTMLMMVLVIFALLQLISGGLFFSSLKQNQDSFAASNDLRLQQSELTSTWDLMLQTRINLSRSSARMMMDPNNQQSSAKTDLLKNARATLAEVSLASTDEHVRLRIRDLVFVQSTLGTLGKRLFELEIPLLGGYGPWSARVSEFRRVVTARDVMLGQLESATRGETFEL